MFRHTKEAAIHVGVVVLIVVVVVAGAAYALLAPSSPYNILEDDPSKDSYVPTMEVTLYRNDAGEIYRADLDLKIEEPGFLEYFFTGSVHPEGLPKGDKELKFEIYEGTLSDRKEDLITRKVFKIGLPDERESTYTIELPLLQLDGEQTVVHLWGYCSFEGNNIRTKHWTVNPDDLSVTGVD